MLQIFFSRQDAEDYEKEKLSDLATLREPSGTLASTGRSRKNNNTAELDRLAIFKQNVAGFFLTPRRRGAKVKKKKT